MSAESSTSKADLISSITEQIAGAPAVSDGTKLVTRALVEAALNELDQRGLLALNPEWDVEYRYGDGTTSRHTEDVFDEPELSLEQATEYAQQYNSLTSAPGSAVILHRFVGPYRQIADTD